MAQQNANRFLCAVLKRVVFACAEVKQTVRKLDASLRNRIVVKSSERSEPPSDLDPIAELVRIVGEDQPALLAEFSDAKKAQRTDRRRQGRR